MVAVGKGVSVATGVQVGGSDACAIGAKVTTIGVGLINTVCGIHALSIPSIALVNNSPIRLKRVIKGILSASTLNGTLNVNHTQLIPDEANLSSYDK